MSRRKVILPAVGGMYFLAFLVGKIFNNPLPLQESFLFLGPFLFWAVKKTRDMSGARRIQEFSDKKFNEIGFWGSLAMSAAPIVNWTLAFFGLKSISIDTGEAMVINLTVSLLITTFSKKAIK